ncbi:MAG: transglycosylase SLT domain-containing protein [Minicystis sp.]
MAAPESTITGVHAAVSAYNQGAAPRPMAQVRPAAPATPLPARSLAVGTAGDESRELSRLRDRGTRLPGQAAPRGQDAQSCDLDRPSFSRTPRYASAMDREVDDADDLDAAGTDALSRLQLPDLKIPVTRRTLKYVRFFTRTDRGRGMFETWLKRSGRYQDLIQTELRDRRLPEDLIWVAMIESGFDARARSPAGAVGLWQFMPATGAVYGLQQSRFLDQRKNPRLATQAAAHHLQDLYLRFGAWDLALAAYNMGYEQLLSAIDRYGTADFNELARQEAIPSETAAYVPKILAAAIVSNNLERFGFDKVEINRPVDSAEIAVPPGTPLKTISKAAGVATSILRTLNPDFLGERVPPGRGDYLVMVPADTLSRARAALPSMLENEPLVADDASVLDPVDLLGGRDFSKLKSRRDDESLLSLLPHPKRRGTMREPGALNDAVEELTGAADDAADDSAEGRDDDPPRRRSHHARSSRETLMYRVSPGDTLIGIARQFAMDVDDVSRQNKLDDGDALRVGALLRLRVKRDLVDGAGTTASRETEKDGKAAHETRGSKERSGEKSHVRTERPEHHDKHKKAHKDQG